MQFRPSGEESIIYIDGHYLAEGDAKISVFDHVVLYGDGVYDTCCAWNGSIFKLNEHIDRLFESAYAVKIQVPLNKSEMKDAVLETVRRNKHQNAYVKIIITRGVGELPLLSPYNCKPSVIIFSKPYMRLVGEGSHEKGIRVKIASLRRIPDQCLFSKVKSINYQNHVLMRLEANEAGYDDALELTTEGYVSEAPGYNVFVVKSGRLITPQENILMGITRQTVVELAEERGIPVLFEKISPFDLFNADEVFFSSTAGGVFPVIEVDGRIIGTGKPGEVTELLSNCYSELLESGSQSTPAF
jgi:branched-chain amino acid aminotransferase